MKRFFSFFLSFVLVLTMIPAIPVSAAGFYETPVIEYTDTSAVSSWTAHFASLISSLDVLSGIPGALMWEAMDNALRGVIPGEKASVREVISSVSGFNTLWLQSADTILNRILPNYAKDSLSLDVGIGFDDARGIYRPYDRKTGLPIVNSIGQFPYYNPNESDTGEESPDRTLGGKWVRVDKVNWNRVSILSEYSFYDIGYALRDYGEDNEVDVRYIDGDPVYEYLVSRDRYENGIPFVYCDKDGQPYVNRPDPDAWAQEQDNNWIIDDDGNTENGQLIDVDTSTIWFPDGTLNFINNMVYDESQKTYYVDASSSYDIDNNYYYTYNYHYEYHIDYTSITYIGQTAEYDEVYEYYYQLPDGRSSADLTAEELQALNTQIDVLPYIRSADDTSIRALYHFDGDTRDSSYWSHLGEFKWNEGASITYMDAGAFNGALYLDENAHDFSISLPSSISTGDFTMQFRLYISSTLTPVYDSYVSINGGFKLGLDGEAIVVDSGQIAPLSNGAWQDICAMRKDGVLYLFLNGVPVKSWSGYSYILDDSVRFVWGSDQQTFKYFDEFRFVNKAIYETDGYTPTSVPFDTNLALVLPDSQLPVADEYWSIESSYENILSQYGLDHWIDFGSNTYLTNAKRISTAGTHKLHYDASGQGWYVSTTPSSGSGTRADNLAGGGANATKYSYAFPYLNYWTAAFSSGSSGSVISNNYFANLVTNQQYPVNPASAYTNYHVSGAPKGRGWVPYGGLLSVLGYSSNGQPSSVAMNGGLSFNKNYTFSLVFSDGSVKSVSFDLSKLSVTATAPSYLIAEHDNTVFGVSCSSYNNNEYATYWLFVAPKDTANGASTDPIVYMELVEGSSTDLTAEFVSSVVAMDKDDLNTPSLAVRTDLDITGYQIGGVRPSLPTKGLVWALVEAGRISSLQIYNGQAWEEVDGRIWTGSRWVPYYAYDVLLLKDMWDIVEADPSLNPIYTEQGFWSWLQGAWGEMMKKLDQIIEALGGTPSTGDPCEHTYESKISREATCSEPGHMTYTCSQCGHTYTELIDAHGHDWTVVNSVPDVLDENGSVIEEGYDELVCTVCDAKSRDYGDGPEEVDLFDALGDFIADGITWILDKLEELADSLRGITEIFNSFRDRISGMAGGFPLFFAGIVALLPEDLMVIFWFAVIGWIVLKVWKKWSN